MSLADFVRPLAEQLSLFPLPTLAPTPAPTTGTPGLLHLGNQLIPYQLRRRARARLALVITEQGLRINAPASLPLRDIEGFARQHGDWVLKKLGEQAAAPRPQTLAIADGCCVPLLDGAINVRVLPGHNRTRWIGDTLLLEARAGTALNTLARRGLQARALTHFQARLEHFAPQLGLTPPPLGLSAARTRWGSCSLHSGIRLNWRLIHLHPELGDYVVVHELAHLHEMNHSPRFWAIVERACPTWRAARNELKRAARTLPLI